MKITFFLINTKSSYFKSNLYNFYLKSVLRLRLHKYVCKRFTERKLYISLRRLYSVH